MDSVGDVASPTPAGGSCGDSGRLELLTTALLPTAEAQTAEGVMTFGELPSAAGVDRTGRSSGRRGSWLQMRRLRRGISWRRRRGSRGGEDGEKFWPKLMMEEGSAAMVFALGAVIGTPNELGSGRRINLLAGFYAAQMMQFLLDVVLLSLYIYGSRGPSRRRRYRGLAKAVMLAAFAPALASIAIVLYVKLQFS